jgi:hypothetical protein
MKLAVALDREEAELDLEARSVAAVEHLVVHEGALVA